MVAGEVASPLFTSVVAAVAGAAVDAAFESVEVTAPAETVVPAVVSAPVVVVVAVALVLAAGASGDGVVLAEAAVVLGDAPAAVVLAPAAAPVPVAVAAVPVAVVFALVPPVACVCAPLCVG